MGIISIFRAAAGFPAVVRDEEIADGLHAEARRYAIFVPPNLRGTVLPSNLQFEGLFRTHPDWWALYVREFGVPNVAYIGDSQPPVYQSSPQPPVYQSAPQPPVYQSAPQPPVYQSAPQAARPEAIHYASGTDTALNVPPSVQTQTFPLQADSQQSPSIGKWVLGILAAIAFFK